MYCVDKLTKLIFFGLLIYYIGGAMFGSYFSTSSMTIADTIVDTIDANMSA